MVCEQVKSSVNAPKQACAFCCLQHELEGAEDDGGHDALVPSQVTMVPTVPVKVSGRGWLRCARAWL